MEDLQLLNPRPALERSRAAEHIVFALTEGEMRLFLPQGIENRDARVQQSWLDVAQMNEDRWSQALTEMKPNVLVTAWSCPTLPIDWIRDETCSLRYLCSITGSLKPCVPRELFDRGILVSNWGNLISHTVAEHALLLLLGSLRSLPLWPDLMRHPQNVFEKIPLLRARTLRGKRVGLHGFGAVARELVAMLQPHQVKLAAYSEGVPESHFQDCGVQICHSLEELFSTSDIIIELEGLNDRTRGSVTAEILQLLPQDAVFINVGRGAVVDETALADLARSGRIRVGLDVFHQESLPQNSPLQDHPSILLSPHVAGPTWDTYPICGQLALENVQRYLNGETPHHLVTLEAYDRAT